MRAHGTHVRYVFGPTGSDTAKGCRCDDCRAAHATYQRDRYRRMHRPDGAGPVYVDCSEARDHLLWLSANDVGRRAVAARTGLARSTLMEIRSGRRTKARRETIEAILAVGLHVARPGSRVPAGPTWDLVDELLAHGMTRRGIARHLSGDPTTTNLQLGRQYVTRRNASAVEALHAEVMRPTLRAREIAAERRARYRRLERERTDLEECAA